MSNKKTARPDDDRIFIFRWTQFINILLIDSTVKHIAAVAGASANFKDGKSCRPGNDLIQRKTGYSDRVVRTAWSIMRGLDMATRVRRGVPQAGTADEYHLHVPPDWADLPVLGPKEGRFACQQCAKLFDPRGGCYILSANDESDPGPDAVRFRPVDMARMVFCSTPTKKSAGKDCLSRWNAQQRRMGARPWGEQGQDRWKYFAAARGDDW